MRFRVRKFAHVLERLGLADAMTGIYGSEPGGVLDHITDRNNGGPEQVN